MGKKDSVWDTLLGWFGPLFVVLYRTIPFQFVLSNCHYVFSAQGRVIYSHHWNARTHLFQEGVGVRFLVCPVFQFLAIAHHAHRRRLVVGGVEFCVWYAFAHFMFSCSLSSIGVGFWRGWIKSACVSCCMRVRRSVVCVRCVALPFVHVLRCFGAFIWLYLRNSSLKGVECVIGVRYQWCI